MKQIIIASVLACSASAAFAQLDYSSAPCGVAWHANTGLRIGATWTAEPGPGPDINDGVAPSLLTRGAWAFINVTVNGPGIAQLWIDMNGDNVFQAAEQMIADAPLPFAGVHNLNFLVPAFGPAGGRFARVRVSNMMGLGPVGGAPSGEVSDFNWFVN